MKCSKCGEAGFTSTGVRTHESVIHGVLPPHGSRRRYQLLGCDCASCVRANRTYNRRRRQRLGER